jgi:hypothetical protein
MGKVIVPLKLLNEADLLLERHEVLKRRPRSVEVDAIVDPYVVSFRLQSHVARTLGIGDSQPARLKLLGRSCLANVIIVDDDQPNVLDRLALLELDLVLDARSGKLIPNPEHGGKWMAEEFVLGGSTFDSPVAPSQSPDVASRSEAVKVAVGFSPRNPVGRGRVAERRLKTGDIGASCIAPRRGRFPTSTRGLKSTATIKRRSATSESRHLMNPTFVNRKS